MHRKHWVTVLVVLVAVLSLSGIEAAAVPNVASYRPSMVAPGADVAMHGRGFGTRKPALNIRYGTGGSPLGQAEIRGWTDARIDVRLPAAIAPGRYWLAIYKNDALKSNQLGGLTVEAAPAPPGSRPRSQQRALPGVRIDPPRARMEQPLRAPPWAPFRPDRVGTSVEHYNRKGGGPDCAEPDREMFVPAAGGRQAYTGYAKYLDQNLGGVSGCQDYTHQLYRGMVRFDVSGLRGKTIERADLTFRATIVENENDPSCARMPITEWTILGRPFRAGLQDGVVGAEVIKYAMNAVTGGQYKVEVTNLVKTWAEGRRNNQGMSFVGRDEGALQSNNKCVVRMSDFALKVDYHD